MSDIFFSYGPLEDPPFSIDAIAIEDDTYFVLGADPEFRPSSEHPIRVHTAALEVEPAAPGSVFKTTARDERGSCAKGR